MTFRLAPEILESLVDPETHEPLLLADADTLDAIARAVRDGRARRVDGAKIPEFEAAFVTASRRRAYLVVDGIPSFIVNERLELPALAGESESAP